MSETKNLLLQLDEKVTDLMGRMKAANEKILQLESENKALVSAKADREELITDLQKQLESQPEAKQSEEEVKERIGEMVKEIDRCISLLKV